MVCLGLEPGVAGLKAQANPLSYGGTPPCPQQFLSEFFFLCSICEETKGSSSKLRFLSTYLLGTRVHFILRTTTTSVPLYSNQISACLSTAAQGQYCKTYFAITQVPFNDYQIPMHCLRHKISWHTCTVKLNGSYLASANMTKGKLTEISLSITQQNLVVI